MLSQHDEGSSRRTPHDDCGRARRRQDPRSSRPSSTPEMRFRPLLPAAGWIVALLLFGLSCFHYYTAGFGLLQETLHRGIHLACVLGLIFLVFSWSREGNATPPKAGVLSPLGIGIIDWLCAIGAVVTSLYVPYVFHDLQFRVGNPDPIDWIMGTIMIAVLLEATRRSVGWPLPIIAIVLMVYALYGRSLPGILAHPGNTWKSVVNHLYLTSQGIYGIALGVVATYVFHYVLFGVLATRVGLGRFFIDLATALTGRFSGGPAKVSIFGSAPIRHDLGFVDREHRHGRLAHHPGDDPCRLCAALCRRRRGGGRNRRTDHAADHGRGRVPDGRVSRRPVSDDHHRGDCAGVHAFLRRVLPDSLRGQEAGPARPAAIGTAGRARGHSPRLADGDAACRAAAGPVLRLHALSRGVLGHHGLHRARPHQSQPGRRNRLRRGDRALHPAWRF